MGFNPSKILWKYSEFLLMVEDNTPLKELNFSEISYLRVKISSF